MKAEYKTIYIHKFGKFHNPRQMSRSIFLRYFPMSIIESNEGLYANVLEYHKIPDVDTFKPWNFQNKKVTLNPKSHTFVAALMFKFRECPREK